MKPQPVVRRRPLPYASKTNLYDDHWASKQERGGGEGLWCARAPTLTLSLLLSLPIAFTRWLNHVLAPVDELGHTVPTQGVTGKPDTLPNMLLYMYLYSTLHSFDPLIQGGNMSVVEFDAPPPPLPEATPTDHTPLPLSAHRQLSRLRRGACLLYQSQPLSLVISRLEVDTSLSVCSLASYM